jgi:hypothetical protein
MKQNRMKMASEQFTICIYQKVQDQSYMILKGRMWDHNFHVGENYSSVIKLELIRSSKLFFP